MYNEKYRDRNTEEIRHCGGCVPLAAFEYEREISYVFTTSGLSELLDLPPAKAAKLYKNTVLFDEYIREITKNPIEGGRRCLQAER
ncbi:MAG: hypothetical protein K2O16_16635 [Lachnospiraceae bacterium]|nr:hypothetical protein [Lachnospiraceae bacterium]MDE7333816.1 hypothetical protein [Lachnospiraceae bacterium]